MTTRTATRSTARSNGAWQGMNWVRPVKRLAIYLRDGLACAWCGAGLESGAVFTLDHLKPHANGGSNHETNLVTCCKHCNDSRGKRGQRAFAEGVAAYLNHGVTPDMILARVQACSRRSLKPYLQQAKSTMAQRGFSAALASLKVEIKL